MSVRQRDIHLFGVVESRDADLMFVSAHRGSLTAEPVDVGVDGKVASRCLSWFE